MGNRKLPFGYHMELGKIVLHPPEAVLVKHVFQAYIAGESYNSLVEWLREQKIPYDVGRVWNKNMVARILEDRRYIGDKGYPAILQEETMTSAIKKRSAKQVTTHITEAQKILRRLSGWTETKQIEQQVLGLLNMLLNNPERIQVVSPHPKSENVELQRQLDAVLSCQPIDEDAAQELIRSIASVQYSAIDADEYESIRLRRIFAQHPVMRELDAKLLKTTVSAIRVYSDKSIAIRLKNNQIIGVNHNERQSTQSHYDPCESGKHSTAGCPAAAASRRLLPGIYR
ncbi:recombinase family protein [Intestinimonas butyriciproducens]|uniref:recombinase family protein n=2 Tax=Intestinimonas butyriciproducens TaxID=1297617 RepID=UPI000E30BD89|nr:recombinase family protein [Intestinimonas butyriciproducens]MCR1904811.1 recombinase family protein [Intestinimonas butyriciproducens]